MTKVSEEFILKNFESAIQNGYIKAYYQPIVRSITRNISDSEALARWEDPEMGFISPLDFIPVLEKHHLIKELDLCILRCICDTYQKLKEYGCIIPHFSINLSRLDFNHRRLFEDFIEILNENNVPVEAIHVEITESVMLDDQGKFREILDKFKNAGFHIWMDDFGSGYSSLTVLKDYEFDLLKIDAAFLKNFGHRSKQMLTAVINMAKALGIHTLTEGIETEEQYSFMLDSGCELIQGFYFFKPLSSEDFIKYVKKENESVEPDDENLYWDDIGNFNFLSSNPLEGFISNSQENQNEFDAALCSKIPLALLEYKNGYTKCVYYNSEYYNRIRQLGYSSVEEIEDSFNERREAQHTLMEKILDKSIANNSIERIDYVENGVYFTIKTKCLSKHNGKYMMAITLYTFGSGREESKSDDILKYGQSIFLTYESILILYPTTNMLEIMFTRAVPEHDYSAMMLNEAIDLFSKKEVFEEDRDRFLSFMEMPTLDKRIDQSGKIFLQEAFRLRDPHGGYSWKLVRLTRDTDSLVVGYLFTVQDMTDKEEKMADILLKEHPELINLFQNKEKSLLDYSDVVEKQKRIASVLSVQLKTDGSCGEICLEAANDIYLDSVNVKREDFVPGKPYYNYVPKDLNYEELSIDCVKNNKIVHVYIDAGFYNAWMEVVMLPLVSAEPDKGYYLFSYDMHPKADASKLSDISPDIAVQIIRTSLKLREAVDFQSAMNAVIGDLREICKANRSCIVLTDFKKRRCSLLCESRIDVISPEEVFLGEGFFDIVEVWERLIDGSNCYIVHDENELEKVKDVDENWYRSLKGDNIYSFVLYPIKVDYETIGYIIATNFDKERTESIKTILGVTSFILASEISNHELLNRMKILSDTDLLTGLFNRNAMNNRVADIVSGDAPIKDNYGVIFIDLNGLKTVNDTEGHTAGDELLKEAADLLKSMFPEGEIYRVGGDEFLIILMSEDEKQFHEIVDKLKSEVEKSDRLKMAIGSCYGDSSMDIRTAMHEADEDMYVDKRDYYRKHNIKNVRN